MKKLMILMVIFAFASISFAQTASENAWIGKYAHENDVGKEYFMLEIYRDGETLKAKYKETITDQTTSKSIVNIVIKGNTASFLFSECLPLTNEEDEDGGRNDCDDYKSGDLLLKVRRIFSGKNVSFKQLGGKLTEEGFAGEIEFVKTTKFYDAF